MGLIAMLAPRAEGAEMGCAGSEVAKEAADMILSDENFASLVNAEEEGQAVDANLWCVDVWSGISKGAEGPFPSSLA
jgi:cation transport ATPase